jgi:hypothetical protein
MAAPSATGGHMPGEPGTKKIEESEMTDSEKKKYADMERRVQELENENAIVYAEEAIASLQREGVKITDRAKEVQRLAALPTKDAKLERIADIRTNYAREERSPAHFGRLIPTGTPTEHIEGATESEVFVPSAAEMVRYAEENKIDMDTDSGLLQVIEGLRKKNKQTAA